MDAKELLAEALRLSAEERATLAGELIQSLEAEVDSDAEAAWSAEIRVRLQRADAGTATAIPWSEARRRIQAAAGRSSRGILNDTHRSHSNQSARDVREARDPGNAIPVELILRKLSEGASEADLINAYSQLTGEDIHAAMRFAADTIAHEDVVFIGKKDADTNRD